ncbi:MAG: hypothetical protein GX496_03105, partial [Firmicutes bacterium]|nr:hypothetical protein [Bacillota bacterium]
MLRPKVEAIVALFQEDGLRTPLAAVVETVLLLVGPGATFLTGRRGRLMAVALSPGVSPHPLDAQALEAGTLPDHLAAAFLRIDAPIAGPEADAVVGVSHSAVLPGRVAGRRLGTLLMIRPRAPFDEEDLV